MTREGITVPPRLQTEDLRLAADLIQASTRVLLTTHRHPDGDATGSLLGLARVLRLREKQVTAHVPDSPPSGLRFLPGFASLTLTPGPLTDYDLFIALDHSELSRTGLAREILAAGRPLIAVDHHATFDRLASVSLVIPTAAATCELLAELLPAMGFSLDADTATCFLTGIVTDTGFFQHANTSARVLATAAVLLKRGADLASITSHLAEERSLAALRIAGRALERLRVNAETGAAISMVTRRDLEDCRATVDDLTGVVNLLNTIPEARFSLLLTETESGKLKGSLRSDPKTGVDVSAIARKFGGGGHRLASGFEVAAHLIRDPNGWRVE